MPVGLAFFVPRSGGAVDAHYPREPAGKVARSAQVAPLRKLLEARTKLADLRNKLAGNDKLEDILTTF